MPINLRVGSDFNEDDARKAKEEADRYYKRLAAELKVKAKLDQASLREAAREADRALGREAVDLKVRADVDKNSFLRAEGALGGLIQRLNEVGRSTAFTARGLATMLAPAAGVAFIDIAKGAVTASQSIALLPAVLGSAAAGFGTLQLATLGFSDAMDNMGDMEKFVESLQSLSPNAQQAALSIKNLVDGPLKDLKMATQDELFAGVGEQLHRLTNEFLPELQSMTTDIAGSFNDMFRGVTDQLMTPETQAAMSNAMSNIADAFKEITPAIPALTQAFADLMSVGSDFLPDLARGAADAAREFANFIREARDSGSLRQFIQDGIDAVGVFADAIFELGGIIHRVFGADGKKNVQDLTDTLEGLNEVIGLLTLDTQTWGATAEDEFGQMTGLAATLRDAWLDIPEAMAVAFNFVIDRLNNLKDHIENVLLLPLNNVIKIYNTLNDLVSGEDLPYLGGAIPDIGHVGPGGDWSGGGPGYWSDPRRPRTGGSGSSDPDAFADLTSPNAGLGPYGGPFGQPSVPSDKPFIDPSQYMIDMSQLPALSGIKPGAGGGPQGVPGQLSMGHNEFGQPTGLGAYVVDPQAVYAAESNLLSAKNSLEQDRLHLLVLEAEGDATQEELLRARNNVAEQERSFYESQLKYQDALQGKWKEASDNISSSMDQIGVALDKDLGISKGLAGMAENLVKFLGNLAAAPLLGPLAAISAAQGGIKQTGSGLIGMIASGLGGGGAGGGGLASILGGGGTAAVPGGGSPLASALGIPTGGGVPYGLPAGSNSGGYGGGGVDFPDWVDDLGAAFGVKPSTYAGHQEDRGEGNQGIDWSGPVENMQKFAEYLLSIKGTPGLEDVIWQNPGTGQKIGVNQGRQVGVPGSADPGYFRNDFGDHTDHVHTTQQRSLPVPGGAGGSGSGLNWDALAASEASGNWANTSNPKYSGGLQFDAATWAQYGGTQYAPTAAQATKDQQIAIAQQAYNARGDQGASLWPQNYQQLQSQSFDDGWGILPPGNTIAQNNTGKPELLVSPGAPGGTNFPGAGPFGPRAGQPGAPHQGTGAPPGPTKIGGGEPGAEPSNAQSGGGVIGAATSAAALAADMFAPGSGAAVQIASQEIQRAIKFGSQAAAIGVGGLLDTFIPFGGSDLAQNNWVTKVAGGFAGVQPQIPNLAGKSASGDAMMETQGAGGLTPPMPSLGGAAGRDKPAPNITVNYTNQGATEDRAGADISSHLRRGYESFALGGSR